MHTHRAFVYVSSDRPPSLSESHRELAIMADSVRGLGVLSRGIGALSFVTDLRARPIGPPLRLLDSHVLKCGLR